MAKRAFGVGGGSTDTLADLISLMGFPSANDNYMTFEDYDGHDYVVPGGKTLLITHAHLWVADAASGILLGYGDDGVGDGAPAPTNPVLKTPAMMGLVQHAHYPVPLDVQIPTGKYPFGKGFGGGVRCLLLGILV